MNPTPWLWIGLGGCLPSATGAGPCAAGSMLCPVPGGKVLAQEWLLLDELFFLDAY